MANSPARVNSSSRSPTRRRRRTRPGNRHPVVPSQHPADRLIRDLIATRRRATPEEVAAIIARMASAPFDGRTVRVVPALRGVLPGATANALTSHLAKRVFDERQWASGTTADDYLNDLRRAVRSPAGRLLVYNRRGGNLAAS